LQKGALAKKTLPACQVSTKPFRHVKCRPLQKGALTIKAFLPCQPLQKRAPLPIETFNVCQPLQRDVLTNKNLLGCQPLQKVESPMNALWLVGVRKKVESPGGVTGSTTYLSLMGLAMPLPFPTAQPVQTRL
jgi:hypothetical protein